MRTAAKCYQPPRLYTGLAAHPTVGNNTRKLTYHVHTTPDLVRAKEN